MCKSMLMQVSNYFNDRFHGVQYFTFFESAFTGSFVYALHLRCKSRIASFIQQTSLDLHWVYYVGALYFADGLCFAQLAIPVDFSSVFITHQNLCRLHLDNLIVG